MADANRLVAHGGVGDRAGAIALRDLLADIPHSQDDAPAAIHYFVGRSPWTAESR